jgi:hypothetical protein
MGPVRVEEAAVVEMEVHHRAEVVHRPRRQVRHCQVHHCQVHHCPQHHPMPLRSQLPLPVRNSDPVRLVP